MKACHRNYAIILFFDISFLCQERVVHSWDLPHQRGGICRTAECWPLEDHMPVQQANQLFVETSFKGKYRDFRSSAVFQDGTKKTSWTLGRPTLWSSSQELQEAVDDCYNLNGWALPKKDLSSCWFFLIIDLFGQLFPKTTSMFPTHAFCAKFISLLESRISPYASLGRDFNEDWKGSVMSVWYGHHSEIQGHHSCKTLDAMAAHCLWRNLKLHIWVERTTASMPSWMRMQGLSRMQSLAATESLCSSRVLWVL